MRRSVLAHLITRKPSKPLRLMMTNGETLDIRHPEAVYLAKLFMAVSKASAENAVYDEPQMVWIDYLHIVHCQRIASTRDLPF